MQGLGWVALEELKWGDNAHPWVRPGHLFTQGPGTYKIPTCNDVPIDFRVMLLEVHTQHLMDSFLATGCASSHQVPSKKAA